jgi:DNA primase
MKLDEARYLMERVGGEKFSVSGRGWLRSTCPFARWTHSGGTDAQPSFAVVTEDAGMSSYKCYGCGLKGTMSTFVFRYERLSGKSNAELHAYVQRTNQYSLEALEARATSLEYGKTKPVSANMPLFQSSPQGNQMSLEVLTEMPVLPESKLSAFEKPSGDVLRYLRGKRKLSDLTISLWELLWDPEKDRIIVPLRNARGELVATSGRAFYDWQKPKYMHSKGFKRDLLLYGENQLFLPEDGVKSVGYVVEGFFDVIKLWQHGYDNVQAIMGSYLSKTQEQKLVDSFDAVVIVPDGDKAGYEAADRMQTQLKKRLRCTVVPMPFGYDPDDLTPGMAETLLGPPSRPVTT